MGDDTSEMLIIKSDQQQVMMAKKQPLQEGAGQPLYPFQSPCLQLIISALQLVGIMYICLAVLVSFFYAKFSSPGQCDNPFLMVFLLAMGAFGLTTRMMAFATFDVTWWAGRLLVWVSRIMVLTFCVLTLAGSLIIATSDPSDSILYQDCAGGDVHHPNYAMLNTMHTIAVVTLLLLDVTAICIVAGLCGLYLYLISFTSASTGHFTTSCPSLLKFEEEEEKDEGWDIRDTSVDLDQKPMAVSVA